MTGISTIGTLEVRAQRPAAAAHSTAFPPLHHPYEAEDRANKSKLKIECHTVPISHRGTHL
jgi:hypothetical protein